MGKSKESSSKDQHRMSISDAEKRKSIYLKCDFCWTVSKEKKQQQQQPEEDHAAFKVSGTAIKGESFLYEER
jgi:hypothetical protein